MYEEVNEDDDIDLYTVEVEDSTAFQEGEEDDEENEENEEEEEEDEDEDGDVGESMPILMPQQHQHQQQHHQVVHHPRTKRQVHRPAAQGNRGGDDEQRSYQRKFSAREKWILCELVDHCRGVLLSKSGKSDIRQRKIQLWQEVFKFRIEFFRNLNLEEI